MGETFGDVGCIKKTKNKKVSACFWGWSVGVEGSKGELVKTRYVE